MKYENIMSNTDYEALVTRARTYDASEQFIAETGWEDWMNNVVDVDETESLTDAREDEIDDILLVIWDEARVWYAVQQSTDDAWDNGSFDFDKALEMAKEAGADIIAKISARNVCVGEYHISEQYWEA